MDNLNSIRTAKILSLVGDKAYDFALPLAIIAISPGNALIAGLFIIIRKAMFISLMPAAGRIMDRISCWRTIQCALGAQMLMVLSNIVIFSSFQGNLFPSLSQNSFHVLSLLFLSAFFDSLRQLGEASSDISVKNFWIPRIFSGDVRTRVNAQLKSMNLSAEVVVPMLTALFLFRAHETNHVPMGFYVVSGINILSFIPEYLLFGHVADRNPKLKKIQAQHPSDALPLTHLQGNFFAKLHQFTKEPVFYAQLAVAFLGLTALSPHSLLLRVYLLDHIGISNSMLAMFSGISAFLGILGVFAYTRLKRILGLIRTTRFFVFLQALLVTTAAIYFNVTNHFSTLLFLSLITTSRFGLYGFTLGSTEIEQTYIDENKTGFVMGMAYALQQLAILLIFMVGTIFPEYSQFYISVSISALGLSLSFFFFSVWSRKMKVAATPRHSKIPIFEPIEPIEN